MKAVATPSTWSEKTVRAPLAVQATLGHLHMYGIAACGRGTAWDPLAGCCSFAGADTLVTRATSEPPLHRPVQAFGRPKISTASPSG
jgi:hypothetical protein